MQALLTLIDKASEMCGSDTALAERLGIARPNISLMRTGKRQISPATAAELADIVGQDPREAAIDAVIESAKGTRRESVLRDILGKALAAGAAGVSAISYNEESILGMGLATKPKQIVKPVVQRIHRIYQTLSGFRKRLRPVWPQFSPT